jgi:hypothetical protein
LKQILKSDNLNKAYKKVKSNKGTGGVRKGYWRNQITQYLKEALIIKQKPVLAIFP